MMARIKRLQQSLNSDLGIGGKKNPKRVPTASGKAETHQLILQRLE